jgi:DNA-binding LacI/PurR family transcriptional regulator
MGGLVNYSNRLLNTGYCSYANIKDRLMPITINDIARVVGVKKSTVSRVLNDRPNPVKVSEETKRKIFQAAKDLGYHPNAAARSLSTRRTGHIGFILSDTIADGWANATFAQVLAGVENACHKRGYGLNISRYNLSNLDSFVFPARVGQRSVDGLVLTGYVEAAVVQRFREFGVPCVCIGDNVEVAGMIPTIACDIVDGLFQAVQYGVQSGHRRIIYWNEQTRRGREVGHLLIDRARAHPSTSDCRVTVQEVPGGLANYNDGKPMMEYWLSLPKEDRPTLVIASDQALVAFLVELVARGFHCPGDISLVSSCDTRLCEYAFPPLCAVSYDLEQFGQMGAEMLIGHLDDHSPFGPQMSRNEPCRLKTRKSVGPARV